MTLGGSPHVLVWYWNLSESLSLDFEQLELQPIDYRIGVDG